MARSVRGTPEPPSNVARLGAVRSLALVVGGMLVFAACGSAAGPPSPPTATPTAAPMATPTAAPMATPTAGPTSSPTAAPTDAALLPLPAGLAGIPQPGTPTAVLQPRTQRGTIPPNVPQRFELGHCGLMSPIDFDGSLWDPVAGDDGSGGPLTDAHRTELFNATPVALTLIEPDVIRMETPLGAVLTLVRHAGARAYSLCD